MINFRGELVLGDIIHAAQRVTVGCDLSLPTSKETPLPGANDWIIGPLAYCGLAKGYEFGTDPAVADRVTFFQAGA
jgi:hypothetical protein